MQPVPEKVVLITGTSSGFGLLTAISAAANGWRVVAGMRDTGKREQLLVPARESGADPRIDVVALDVTHPSSIDNALAHVINTYGRLDALVNNAGMAMGGFIEELDLTTWREQFETNVFGVIAVTKAVLPVLREARRGCIINVSSISGRMGFPAMGPYVASKFALEGFTEALRLEMGPFGVRVVLVEPASYKTAIWQKGLATATAKPNTPYAELQHAVQRGAEAMAVHGGDPQEVADLIVRLLEDAKPRLRYPVGKGVHALIAAKTLLPWRWVERSIARRLQR